MHLRYRLPALAGIQLLSAVRRHVRHVATVRPVLTWDAKMAQKPATAGE